MRMETTLMADANTFDKRILIEIYEEHSPGLFRYAFRLLGDRDQAEECVAETFSRFLNTLHRKQAPIANVQAYLYRMAHNWVTDQYRRRRPEFTVLDPDGHPDHRTNPSQMMIEAQETERVRSALRQLSAEQQTVIVLRVIEDWPHEKVALLLGKSVEATRALQYRAMNTLRRILSEQQEKER